MEHARGRLLAIGDLHGFTRACDALLEAMKLQPGDQLILMGDYVDKGPDPKGLLDRLILLAEQRPDTIFLRGNHDQLMIDAFRDPAKIPIWESIAGNRPLASYGDSP